MRCFIFDVDGTLTPSRATIDPEFKEWFLEFIKREKVWLVTGSDYPKTKEQLGAEICESVVTVYNCQGNDTWFRGKRVNAREFVPPSALFKFLHGWLNTSAFPLRTGTHIEERRGMMNFSIVGRGATKEERAQYVEWDLANRERETIALQINMDFPGITATVGGETGLDIHNTGADKSQILDDFDPDIETHFFGDRMEQGGNDWPLAHAMRKKRYKGKSHHVTGWQNTWDTLRGFT